MNSDSKTKTVLLLLSLAFIGLATIFFVSPSAMPAHANIPLVDTNFLDTVTVRKSYADLIKAGEDLSDFDCYACHEKGKAPPLRYDANGVLIIPKEHSNIVMHHGSHERNNNCFNCHNETNLEELQTRDKHQLKLSNSTPLCGSCHGPTYRDWEAGVHGRTGNYWKRTLSEQDRQKLAGLDLKNFGAIDRKDCVNCHNPHSPEFPGRKPAPGPHPLHGGAGVTHPKTKH